MKHRLLEILCCPACRGPLTLDATEEKYGEVRSGELACGRCGASYPIVGYVPRFVDREAAEPALALQHRCVRRHFDAYVSDRSGDARLVPYTGFDVRDLRRGLTLEVGCGYGRFLNTVSHRGGEIVGVDVSASAADLAFDFVGRRPKVHVIQADLFRLPLRDGAFARAFAIGVLHHTPDPEAAVRAIAPKLAPGGQLSIWVSHPASRARAVELWRKVTTRLPPATLYALCVLNQLLLSPARRVPKLGGLLGRLLPGFWPHPGTRFWQRAIGDFDTLAPARATSHEPEEALRWLAAAGLEGVKALGPLTAVTGTAPARIAAESTAVRPEVGSKRRAQAA
jgi:SAM-dependent methyltransferase